MGGTLDIQIEPPGSAEARRLIALLDRYQTSLYPVESNHLVDPKILSEPGFTFFVARLEGAAVGCGALRRHDGFGEIKRMFVLPEARGRGVAQALLARIEAAARDQGYQTLCLETGIHQEAAITLYRAAGFVERPPFGGYPPDPLSIWMEKPLG